MCRWKDLLERRNMRVCKAILPIALGCLLATSLWAVETTFWQVGTFDNLLTGTLQGVSLTKIGQKIAVEIVRKHRLWEVFLLNKLNYNWDEVHELAEQLEHIKSDTLTDKLEAFLEFPTHDPHGDPIPDKEGNIEHHKDTMLSSVETEKSCVVIGIKDSSDPFLKFLDKLQIQLGSTLKVISKEPFDNSMLVKTESASISISNQISKNIFVKKL